MTKNLKLNALADNKLSEREMKEVVGGSACGCGCAVADTYTNGSANSIGGKHSRGMLLTDQVWFLDEVEVRP